MFGASIFFQKNMEFSEEIENDFDWITIRINHFDYLQHLDISLDFVILHAKNPSYGKESFSLSEIWYHLLFNREWIF